MALFTDHHYVYVDSHDRLDPDKTTHSRFMFDLHLPKNIPFTHVVVTDAIIPKSFYLFQTGRNTFTLTELGVSVTVTIPVGNYMLTTFKTVIGPLLTTASPKGYTYVASYPNINTQSNTGKYTYTVTGNSGNQPSFTFGTTNVAEVMGFEFSSTNTFVANSLTSANVVKLQQEDRIFVNSDISTSGLGNLSVLQSINVSPSPDFSTVVYQCTAPEVNMKELTSNSSIMTFSLTDEDGQLLETNGVNVVMTLLFFRRIPVLNLLEKYLNYLNRPKN